MGDNLHNLSFTIVLREEEIGFSVQCVELPGCISQGDTREQALKNIQEAVEGYLEAFPEDNQLLKSEKEVITISV